jgi:hypothetical protein
VSNRDPVIPGLHRTIYGQEVAANGGADWLVQRSVPGGAGGYGHCTYTPQELTQAFFDLVVWGESGVKPTPCPTIAPRHQRTASWGCAPLSHRTLMRRPSQYLARTSPVQSLEAA